MAGRRHAKRRTEVPAAEVLAGERWELHPDFPDYSVSSNGRVWSRRGHGRFLKPCDTRFGHRMVMLGRGNNRLVHRLVMEAFVGPRPDGFEVRHLNGNGADNRLANLAYGTRTENIRDALAHGTWHSERRQAGWRRSGLKQRNRLAAQDTCRRGHPLTIGHPNVYLRPREGWRQCRACARINAQQAKEVAGARI